LDGTDTIADTVNYNLEQQAVLMTWNISATGNYSRVLYFKADKTETVYVFVPDVELPYYLYGFVVNDFVGVTNGYLESMVYVNGSNRVVERQPINTINAAPFYMAWSKKYDMRVVCDEGTLSLGAFTALAETSPTVMIPMGAFPRTINGLLVSAIAARLNATAIQANYTDTYGLTYWVRANFTHRLNNGLYVSDYSELSTSNSYSVTWTGAEINVDYLVRVDAYRSGGLKSWTFSCPYTRNNTNIWEPLNSLGDLRDLPLEAQYVPAIVLIIAALLSFSYAHISVGVWCVWAIAGVCYLFGWLPYDAVGTPVVLGLGAFVCGGITFGEFKKTERTV
jgi:hypothetical protein